MGLIALGRTQRRENKEEQINTGRTNELGELGVYLVKERKWQFLNEHSRALSELEVLLGPGSKRPTLGACWRGGAVRVGGRYRYISLRASQFVCELKTAPNKQTNKQRVL